MLGLFYSFGGRVGFSWLSPGHCSASFVSCWYWPRNWQLCFLITTFCTNRSWLPVGTCTAEPTTASSPPSPFPVKLHSSMQIPGPVAAGRPQIGGRGGRRRWESQSCMSPLAASRDMLQQLHPMMTGLTTATHRQARCIWVSSGTGLWGSHWAGDHTAPHCSKQEWPDCPRGTRAMWGPPYTGQPMKRTCPCNRSWRRA